MKTCHILLAIATALLLSLPSCHRNREVIEGPIEQMDTVYPLGFCTDSFDLVSGTLRRGEIFTALMTRLGLSSKEAWDLSQAADSVFDMRHMREGNTWEAYYDADTSEIRGLQYLVYYSDKVHLTVFRTTPPYDVWKVEKDIQSEERFADVTINSSLWNDMIAAGASPSLIVDLAEIYAWTVDFFGLQKGDRFRVLYEDRLVDGERIGSGDVLYALFERDTLQLPAIRFDARDTSNTNIWWNERGESMKKAFLKAPLKFTRISSGFSYARRHPVHGDVRPHTAVDYAAPTGTPVMALGDGTIISKGWAGGGGNTVKIRHNSVYTTSYMHLSRYADIKVGDRVTQGQVIGYVGMTGTATGPHLDFRVWENGTPINPLTLDSPSAEPLDSIYLPALDSVARGLRARVDSLTQINK